MELDAPSLCPGNQRAKTQYGVCAVGTKSSLILPGTPCLILGKTKRLNVNTVFN